MVGAAIIVLMLWPTSSGVRDILGTVGSTIGDSGNVIHDEGVSTPYAEQQAQEAQAQAEAHLKQVNPASAVETVKDAAWGTAAGLIFLLAASMVGARISSSSMTSAST